MSITELLENLSLDAEWAAANEWETPITLADDLREAINLIKTLSRVD